MPDPPSWRFEIQDSTTALHRREEFVRYLETCGAAGDLAGAELIFGEIVSNAVIHAPGPIGVVVSWSAGRAMLHVYDAGVPLDDSVVSKKAADPLVEHGRGLAIVRELSPGVIVDNAYPDGKTVSAELPVRLA